MARKYTAKCNPGVDGKIALSLHSDAPSKIPTFYFSDFRCIIREVALSLVGLGSMQQIVKPKAKFVSPF